MTSSSVDNKKVEVIFPSGTSKFYEWPTTGFKIVQDEEFKKYSNIVGIKINEEVKNLNCLIRYQKIHVEPVELHSVLGQKMYRRTLVFLLAMAVRMEFPNSYV